MSEHEEYARKCSTRGWELAGLKFDLQWLTDVQAMTNEYASDRALRLGDKPMNGFMRKACKELQLEGARRWHDLYADRVDQVFTDREVMQHMCDNPDDYEEGEFATAPIQVCAGTYYNVGPNRWVFVYDEEWLK